MALHFMSDKELSRVEILRDLTAGRLTVSAASELMGLERRQVLRLSKAYQEHGATALISKKRGRASNRQTPTDIKAQALGLIRACYADFGPTLAVMSASLGHGLQAEIPPAALPVGETGCASGVGAFAGTRLQGLAAIRGHRAQ